MECSDVAGYVKGVGERIGEHLKMLDALEEVTTRLMSDQSRVSDSTDEARLLSEQAKSKLEAGREAIDGTIEGFKSLTELIVQLGERMAGFASAMNQVQNVSATIEAIARKTSMIQTSVDRVKAGLTEFAGDARDNGTQLLSAQKRLAHLEMLSNTMLDTLANSGAEIDDTPFVLMAQEACRHIEAAIDLAIDESEVSLDDVFDRDYQIVEGTNPVQYDVRFNEAADRLVRPILDRTKGSDNRIIGSAIGDTNGYLPTHLPPRSHPQGPDPVWNDEHCRNKRILIDDTTRMALASEKPAMLATYRMELGDKFIPVKNVFVPLWVKGRRWGNFELAYRDD